ncbi:MAG: TonB-dependent receptor, partial [Marinomonas gallaica]
MIGARFDKYESTAQNKLLNANDEDYERSIDDTTFSPNIGIVWRPASQHAVYASYSRSFAPFGGRVSVNSVRSSQDLDFFNADPQYNDQYEVGVKSDWLNQRLMTQLSVFDIEKSNIRYRPDPDNDPYRWAIQGEQESQGIELSFIGRIAEDMYVRGGYGYNKATVKEDKTSPENEGKTLSGVPRHTGNLFLRYLPTESSYTEIGVTHVGDTWTNSDNTNKLEGFNRVDAAVGYNIGAWRTSLAITNLLDKEYWRSSSMPGTPRSVLARVSYKFD